MASMPLTAPGRVFAKSRQPVLFFSVPNRMRSNLPSITHGCYSQCPRTVPAATERGGDSCHEELVKARPRAYNHGTVENKFNDGFGTPVHIHITDPLGKPCLKYRECIGRGSNAVSWFQRNEYFSQVFIADLSNLFDRSSQYVEAGY